MLRRLLVQEEIERHAAAAAGIALLRNAVRFASQRRDAHTRHRLAVEAEAAIARRHQDFANAVGIVRLHLEHAVVVRAGCRIGALHQIDALGQAGLWATSSSDTDCVWTPSLKSVFTTLAGPGAIRAATRAALRIFSGLRSSL